MPLAAMLPGVLLARTPAARAEEIRETVAAATGHRKAPDCSLCRGLGEKAERVERNPAERCLICTDQEPDGKE